MPSHNANANGLSEYTNAFRLMSDISLTLWARDVYAALTATIIHDGQWVRSTDIDIRLTESAVGEPAFDYERRA